MVFNIPEILAWLIPFMQSYGALSVFIAVMIEEIIIPIPSPIVLMAAGFVLISPSMSFTEAMPLILFNIVLPGAVATMLGSLIIYAVARYGGEAVIKRFRRFFETDIKEIEKTGKKLGKGKKTWITIAVLRAIPIFPTSIVSLASGFLHLNAKMFAIATFIGAIPRLFILSFIGWQLGSAYTAIAGQFGMVEDIIFAALVIAVIAFVIYWKKKH